MSKKDKKKIESSEEVSNRFPKNEEAKTDSKKILDIGEFVIDKPAEEGISSAERLEIEASSFFVQEPTEMNQKGIGDEVDSVDPKKEKSSREEDPIFKKLAKPVLPELPKANRARLQMQSPNKLYFYWSIKNNPFKILNRALGKMGSYALVAKLVDRTRNIEQLFPVDAEGNWWFDVEADSNYRAEVGFYAPNRPFVRIVFSNEVQTPRKNPSKRTDLVPNFEVSADQFAEVLDVSGYKRDAFEVAMAGDDLESAEEATKRTYFKLVGKETEQFSRGKGDELRFVLLALASGYSLDDVRPEISRGLFNELEADKESLDAERVLSALQENFEVFTDEFYGEEEEIGSAIFGASSVNFPKYLKKKNIPRSLIPKQSEWAKPDSLSSFLKK